jgi:hypothetical protein
MKRKRQRILNGRESRLPIGVHESLVEKYWDETGLVSVDLLIDHHNAYIIGSGASASPRLAEINFAHLCL